MHTRSGTPLRWWPHKAAVYALAYVGLAAHWTFGDEMARPIYRILWRGIEAITLHKMLRNG